jgi:glycosyltransferase involved in cell wall biosynthesis
VRVCFFHAAPEWTGGARAFVDAAGALRDRGFEVTLVCGRDGAAERRFQEAGHDVIGLRVDGGWARVAWRLRAVLRRHFVEVVFVHTEREQLVAAAAVRLADRGALVRRVPPLARLTMGGDAALAMRLAATGFLFALEADLRASRPPARALEPVVAPPGVAPAGQRSPGAPEPGVRSIVCVFDEARRARVATALRAVALLSGRHPDLRLVLAGPGTGDDALRIQATALGIGGITQVVDEAAGRAAVQGRIASADLGWVLAAGDAAAFGALDFLAAGVPVLADRDPISACFIADDVNGLLAAGLDAAALAALLASLLADHERHARLAHAARAAAARWPLDVMTDGFERAAAAARDRTRWRV